MDEQGTLAEREAVRLPLWLSIIGAQVFAAVTMLLQDVDWRTVVVTTLASLGPVLFGTEVARGRAWSPVSVLQATVAAREDERARNPTASITLTAHPTLGVVPSMADDDTALPP